MVGAAKQGPSLPDMVLDFISKCGRHKIVNGQLYIFNAIKFRKLLLDKVQKKLLILLYHLISPYVNEIELRRAAREAPTVQQDPELQGGPRVNVGPGV